MIRNLASGAGLLGSTDIVGILDLFDRPRTPREAVSSSPPKDRSALLSGIAVLRRLGFLIPEKKSGNARSRVTAWRGNFAAAQYHSACRDLPYLREPAEIARYVRTHILSHPKPPRFKRYRRADRVRLAPAVLSGEAVALSLSETLHRRRTVREFRSRPVPLPDFAFLLRETFGVTGVYATDLLGEVALKTSPSAGARHPVEAYVLAWNVEDLAPGLYHYDVAGDELRRLRRGDFRRAAVEAASGQEWIGAAAFLCVMTAVFPRVLWKYPLEDAYRTLFLDAGHLAQTFCLVATSLGLGPFTTAAIQDSRIEKLLRIDGVEEFPVYLCGAGVPAHTRRGVGVPKPRPRGKKAKGRVIRRPLASKSREAL